VHPTPTQAIGTSTRSALPWTQSASRFKAHLSHFIKLFLRDALPVFLPLRELEDLSKGIDAFIEQSLDDDPHMKMTTGFGARLLNRGHLLLLFDGLDEVSDPKEREKVARWLERAARARPTCTLVVTCRFAGYDDAAVCRVAATATGRGPGSLGETAQGLAGPGAARGGCGARRPCDVITPASTRGSAGPGASSCTGSDTACADHRTRRWGAGADPGGHVSHGLAGL
nr:NACHT domain-containing protein [Gammaproteobacteria bacterium]